MRIQSITEANTNQQFNPYAIQKTDFTNNEKSASLTSFKDYLKSQIQDDGGLARSGDTDNESVVAVWGYYMPQWVPTKPELKLRTRAYDSMSDY